MRSLPSLVCHGRSVEDQLQERAEAQCPDDIFIMNYLSIYVSIYLSTFLFIYCDLPVDPVAGVGEAEGELLLLDGGQQQGRGDQHHRDLQQRHLRRQSLYAL